MIGSFKRQIASTALAFVLGLNFTCFPSPQTAPLVSQAQMASQNPKGMEEKLKFLEERIEALRKDKKIPGMAVAVVGSQQLIFAKGFGFMDGERQRPTTPDTSFCIASVTKPFTAAVFMRLAEAGKLDLNSEVIRQEVFNFCSQGFCREIFRVGFGPGERRWDCRFCAGRLRKVRPGMACESANISR
jgi:hypothetical protein